jgi:hypothetical protein
LSTSEQTDFDGWLHAQFADTGAFTALAVLVSITETKVFPLCSTYFNVIGTELDWNEIVILFQGCGQSWDGASFFPVLGAHGGPLDNPAARLKLRELEQGIDADKLLLNEGNFFDKWGRRLKVEEIELQ